MATAAARADSTSSSPVEPTSPLSRLRQYSKRNPNSINRLPLSLRKQYESAAKSVKIVLISDLTSRSEANVEAMVDLANSIFSSSDSLHAEYSDFYATVSDFISYNHQYSVAKSELERNKNDMQSHENIIARAKAEAELLGKADTDLSDARNRLSSISNRIAEIWELLQKLKEEKEEVESACALLKFRYDSCCMSKAKMDESVEQVDNKRKILEQIKGRCNEAEAGIKQSVKALFSYCDEPCEAKNSD